MAGIAETRKKNYASQFTKEEKKQYLQEKEEAMDTLMESLYTEVKSWQSEENQMKYFEMLHFMAKCYRYSGENPFLIQLQRPGSRFCCSYKAWKSEFGVNVKKGEKGMFIRVPVEISKYLVNGTYKTKQECTKEEWAEVKNDKPKTIRAYKWGSTFDVSQTDMPPEKYPEYLGYRTGAPDPVKEMEIIGNYLESHGIKVEYRELSLGSYGYYSVGSDSITINNVPEPMVQFQTLIHELAHYELHSLDAVKNRKDKVKYSDEEQEIQADSLTVLMNGYFNLETSPETTNHIGAMITRYMGTTDKDKNLFDSLKTLLSPVYDLYKDMVNLIEGKPCEYKAKRHKAK